MSTGGATRRIHRIRDRLPTDLREVVSGSALVFAGKILGAAFAFAFNVALGRMVGADGAGVYYLAASVTVIAATLGRIGLDQSVLRFSAAHAKPEEKERLAGVHRQGLLIATAGSTATTLAVLAAAPWIAHTAFHEPTLTTPLRLMALGILPVSLGELYAQLLYGIRRARDATLMHAVSRPIIALALLLGLSGHWGTEGAVVSYVLSNTLILLAGALMWRRATPHLRDAPARFDLALLIRTSIPLFWVASLNLVIGTTDTLMLGHWTTSSDVGIYNAAMRTAAISTMALIAVNNVVGPRFASLWADGNREGIIELTQWVTLLMLGAAIAFLTGCILFADLAMGMFGPEFLAGTGAFMILAVGEFFILATGPASHLLVMTGHEKFHRNVVLGSAALNVALNAALIPLLGLAGAAWATTISFTIKNLLYIGLVKKKLRFPLFNLKLLPRLVGKLQEEEAA